MRVELYLNGIVPEAAQRHARQFAHAIGRIKVAKAQLDDRSFEHGRIVCHDGAGSQAAKIELGPVGVRQQPLQHDRHEIDQRAALQLDVAHGSEFARGGSGGFE